MRGFRVTRQTAELIRVGKLNKILDNCKFEITNETLYLCDDKFAIGRITVTSMEEINGLFCYAIAFRPFKRDVPYKSPVGTINLFSNVEFDDAYKDSIEFIKNVKEYDPRKLNDKVLLDDWRIAMAWYSNIKKGRKMPHSLEDIENVALLILKEMIKRGIKMNPSGYTPAAKELYDKLVSKVRAKNYFIGEDPEFSSLAVVKPSGNKVGEAVDVNTILEVFKEFKLSSPWVMLVGGVVENGATEGDFDVLIREDIPNLPLEFRICRQFEPDIAKRIHFLYDQGHFGPFTSYIPIYDKVAQMRPSSSLVEMDEAPFSDEDFEMMEDFMVKPFGHPAGQGFTARTIVKFITPHKTFVEPFAGSASVFFTMKPSTRSVLNDLNENYTFVFRTIKSLTDAEIKSLKSDFDWKSKRDTWHQCKANIKNKTYKGKLHRLWNFIYWSKFAYNGGVGMGAWRKHKDGASIDINFEQIRERLKNTSITQKDYRECLRENDAKDTFFYIDPPYYPADDPRFKSANIGGIDMAEFEKICSNLKGNAIISLGRDKKVLDLFSKDKWALKKIATKYGYGWQEQKQMHWPILLNFDFTKDVGSYQYEEFEISDMTPEELEAWLKDSAQEWRD
jgi:DNA adenine methylase